jgi:hypothetical protein
VERGQDVPVAAGDRKMLKKFGYAGIVFFTLKGMLWLLLPVLAAFWVG